MAAKIQVEGAEVDVLLKCHVYALVMHLPLTAIALDTFLLHQSVMHTNLAWKLLSHVLSGIS